MPTMSTSSGLMGFLQLLPGVLLWLITFITITLPTWTFTLFQTSLTVTMNATTVYERSYFLIRQADSPID
jgi:hypothetical protein